MYALRSSPAYHCELRSVTLDLIPPARRGRSCHPARPGRILDVLLHTALQHGVGKVSVSATPAKGYVTVSVADEGPRPAGNAVFQRTPGKSTAGGEGIGLALSAELAEALGGHLLLDASPTTRFSLILPQKHAE